jgi:hypothetical protein
LAFHSGREADHSPPSSADVKEWVELYLHSPNTPSWRVSGGTQGQLYFYSFIPLPENHDMKANRERGGRNIVEYPASSVY